MEQAQLIGYGVIALSAIIGFVVTVLKFVQPINELRVVIQELKDCINNIIKDNTRHTQRLDKHRDQIEELQKDVVEIKLMMNVYHKEDH